MYYYCQGHGESKKVIVIVRPLVLKEHITTILLTGHMFNRGWIRERASDSIIVKISPAVIHKSLVVSINYLNLAEVDLPS